MDKTEILNEDKERVKFLLDKFSIIAILYILNRNYYEPTRKPCCLFR